MDGATSESPFSILLALRILQGVGEETLGTGAMLVDYVRVYLHGTGSYSGGCSRPGADNFRADASWDDGSCTWTDPPAPPQAPSPPSPPPFQYRGSTYGTASMVQPRYKIHPARIIPAAWPALLLCCFICCAPLARMYRWFGRLHTARSALAGALGSPTRRTAVSFPPAVLGSTAADKFRSDVTHHTLNMLAPTPSLNAVGGSGFHLQLTNASDDDVLLTSLLVAGDLGHAHIFAQRPTLAQRPILAPDQALREARSHDPDDESLVTTTADADGATVDRAAAKGVAIDGVNKGRADVTGEEAARAGGHQLTARGVKGGRAVAWILLCPVMMLWDVLTGRRRMQHRRLDEMRWMPGSMQAGVRRWVSLGDAALSPAWRSPAALRLHVPLPIPAQSSRRIYVRAENELMTEEALCYGMQRARLRETADASRNVGVCESGNETGNDGHVEGSSNGHKKRRFKVQPLIGQVRWQGHWPRPARLSLAQGFSPELPTSLHANLNGFSLIMMATARAGEASLLW